MGAWNKVPECLSSERSEGRGQAAQGAESGSKDRGMPTLGPKPGSDHYSSEGPSAHSPGTVNVNLSVNKKWSGQRECSHYFPAKRLLTFYHSFPMFV